MCDVTEESEAAQARLKGLDESAPAAATSKPHKDVNTFINNQLKFSSVTPAQPLPASQIKCNILKAKAEENVNLKNSASNHLVVFYPNLLYFMCVTVKHKKVKLNMIDKNVYMYMNMHFYRQLKRIVCALG